MRNPVSPSEAAAQLLEYCRLEKGLSIAETAAALGYRSPNSIERIVKGRAGDAARKSFLNQCFSVFPELARLTEYAQIRSPLPEPVWSRLLQGRLVFPAASTALLEIDGHPLGSIGSYYASLHVSSIHVLLLNGLHRPLTTDLSVFLNLPDAKVNHCLTLPYRGDSFSEVVLSLMPLAFNERYHLTRYHGKTGLMTGVFNADIMFIRYRAESTEHMDMILFTAYDKATRISLPAESSLERLGLSAIVRRQYPIIARKDLEFHADYPAYLQWCAELEAIGPIRQIKADVGLEQIPMPVLARALREGTTTSEHDANQLLDIVPEMAEICNRRWQTWHFHRKEHIHMMRLSSLWQFVKTGMMSDHFWGLRAFTVSERILILEELKKAICSKNYRLLFLPDSYWNDIGELSCYGSTQLSFIDRNTSYDLSGFHKELFLTDSKVVQSFIRFFDEFLVPLCSKNVATQTILDEMLHELKNTQRREHAQVERQCLPHNPRSTLGRE